MSDDMRETIGRHDEAIDNLKAAVARIEGKLDAIADTMAQARGGWRALMLVGGIAGTLGALLGKLLPFGIWK